MQISGVQKFTLLDYPEKTSCIVFTAGCNFRCGYCHNPEFVLPEELNKIKNNFIEEETFFRFLDQRRGLLDGVVISGGEPTIMWDLPNFIKRIKEQGFLVKLDTNGNNPLMLEKILKDGLVDYIAMDLKTNLDSYKELAGSRAIIENIEKSIFLIMSFGLLYEFRTTLVRELHTESILKDMADMIEGANVLYLQKFRPGKVLDSGFEKYTTFSDNEMDSIAKIFKNKIKDVIIRN